MNWDKRRCLITFAERRARLLLTKNVIKTGSLAKRERLPRPQLDYISRQQCSRIYRRVRFRLLKSLCTWVTELSSQYASKWLKNIVSPQSRFRFLKKRRQQ